MRVKYIYLLVVIVMLSGCADFRDKFIRKPKEDSIPTTSYQAVRIYDVQPSLDLYTKRYIFWKNWHRELLGVLSNDNQKKRIVAVEQEVSNLLDMQNMLVDEKADELQVYIDELSGIERTLKEERVTPGNEVRIRRELEAIGKQVKRNFSYTKMRGYIRSDFRTQ